jgi:hypothetical protein
VVPHRGHCSLDGTEFVYAAAYKDQSDKQATERRNGGDFGIYRMICVHRIARISPVVAIINACAASLRDAGNTSVTCATVRQRWRFQRDADHRSRQSARSSDRRLIDVRIGKNRVRAADAESSRINGAAPAGEARHLKKVELLARGMSRFGTSEPEIFSDRLRLPDWDMSLENLWPEPQANPAVAVASLVPRFDNRFNEGKWYEALAERDQAQAADARRVSASYTEAAHDREERDNAEARARAEAMRMGKG